MGKAGQLQFGKVTFKVKDFFLPLLDDWFIRPLYFIDSLDNAALQTLAQAIYAYLTQFFSQESPSDLIRVSKSELVFLTAYLLKTLVENLQDQSLALMD